MATGCPRGMTLHRFFVPAETLTGEEIVFPSEQAHQIRHVLRLRPGDRVIVLDGAGDEMMIRLEEVRGMVRGVIEQRSTNRAEPHRAVVLYQGLLKAAKFELVLQKGTEIGLARFVPVHTERSVPAEPNPARQRRFATIVREAAEQSRRGRIPAVSPSLNYMAALQQAIVAGPTLLLWEDEESMHLEAVPLPPSDQVSVFVGPEGGFSPEEVVRARELGVQVVTLGRRILRAETAAIIAPALLLARLGELG